VIVLGLTVVRHLVGSGKKQGSPATPPTEKTVETSWGELCCDPVQPTTSTTDSRGIKLPEGAILISDFMSTSECQKIISAAEEFGFGTTPYPKSYRGNLRLSSVDFTLASQLMKRVFSFAPSDISLPDGSSWALSNLNEQFRLSKYLSGDEFKPHVDAKYLRSEKEQSMFTLNIYLNESFSGGATRFYNKDRDKMVAEVTPVSGLCLLFRQPPGAYLVHDGEMVKSGTKYLLRTDLLYTRVNNESFTSSARIGRISSCEYCFFLWQLRAERGQPLKCPE